MNNPTHESAVWFGLWPTMTKYYLEVPRDISDMRCVEEICKDVNQLQMYVYMNLRFSYRNGFSSESYCF